MASDINQQTFSLPYNLSRAVEKSLDEWTSETKVKRLWARDASLWTGGDESKWLGWLDIVDAQQRNAKNFEEFAREIRSTGFTHALLLGMGGSSLRPEVLDLPLPGQKYTFGIVKAAQARGDFEVLAERRRRALRVHLGADVNAGLTQPQSSIIKAIA